MDRIDVLAVMQQCGRLLVSAGIPLRDRTGFDREAARLGAAHVAVAELIDKANNAVAFGCNDTSLRELRAALARIEAPTTRAQRD